ncbi:MAG TPA: hypothetical protein VGP08_14020 [Pyrinomonadaceae bacterium]|jgi:hypothetical protein|nr:hypothetical protein [Pyrinomonadaceae bacterium]
MLIRSEKVWEWWMRGTGWLWLARLLNVAGAVGFVLFVWTFLSTSINWLLYFFISLTTFFVASKIKKRSVTPPVSAEHSGRGANALREAGEHMTALPPRPMFDREGRTPLERVFTQDEDVEEGAGARRRFGK